MILAELLNTKFTDVKVVIDEDDEYEVNAKIGERVIKFGSWKQKSKIVDDVKKNIWNVAFSEQSDLIHDEFRTTKFDLTGSGYEFQVFSFIKQCMEKMIAKHHPDIIKFTTEKVKGEEKRAAVYEKMLKKFLKGYSFTKKEIMLYGDPITMFTLEKK